MDDLLKQMPEELPQLIGAGCVLFIGILVITKVTKLVMKLGILIIIIAVLAVLYHDKLPI